MSRFPFGLLRLAILLLHMACNCPRECLCLLSNVHTVMDFSRCLRTSGIGHLHAYFLSWPACIAVAVAKLTGCSFSIAAHARDIFVEAGAAAIKVKAARFVIVCTAEGQERLRMLVPDELRTRIRLIRHGIDMRGNAVIAFGTPDQERERQTTPMILAVGRLVAKKGFEYLIRAFSEAACRIPKCRLFLVGDGAQRDSLTKLIHSLQLEGSIRLLGWRPNSEVHRLMRQATALVVPSVIAADGDRDGVPNVILEAMAGGTSVVASRLPAIQEVVRNERTGLLVTPADVDELAEALVRIVKDKDLRDRLAGEARMLAAKHYDLDRNVELVSHLLTNEVERVR
jgi:glycosyltransferase involved in cell wall biosynthesis